MLSKVGAEDDEFIKKHRSRLPWDNSSLSLLFTHRDEILFNYIG